MLRFYFRLIVFFILLCSSAHAGMVIGSGAAPPSYLVSENFDGSTACGDGATSTCNNTWTSDNGTFTFNYTTSPAPLEGTYSCYSADNANEGYYIAFTAQDTVYWYAIINAKALVGGNAVLEFRASDGITILTRLSNANPEFRISQGDTTAYSTTWTQGTTYHVWGDYTKATGAGNDGVAHLYHATTDTKPESPNITITTGTAQGQAARLYLMHSGASAETIYDKIRISTTDIGSTPD